MNKLRQILQFIRALLGFLLNLKKKEKDEKKEEVGFLLIHCSHRRCPRKMKQSNAL